MVAITTNRQSFGIMPAWLLCGLFCATGLPATAQEFSLFEEVEVSPDAQAVQQRQGRESRVTTSAPPFTLVGTSRLGDKYSVILADQTGKQVHIETPPNTVINIPEHMNYQIVAVEGNTVSVRHPESSPCVDFPEVGINCNGVGNIAELTLPNKPPIAKAPTPAQLNSSPENNDVQDGVIEDSQNPFAIMRARARAQGADNLPDAASNDNPAGNNRFVPRRIDPSEVPPGSRIISTPFGDRLVQQ